MKNLGKKLLLEKMKKVQTSFSNSTPLKRSNTRKVMDKNKKQKRKK